jgi:aminopeptidase N
MVISAKVDYNLDIKYWHKISNPQDSIPFRFYWSTGETGLANIETKVLQMCDRYSTLWGEHPFEKNGFATLNNLFQWGGMENQTLTSLCPDCWDEDLVSHEFAHQWFGDMITCATWADIFLNEGFATFCEAIWVETTSGYTSYKSYINTDANNYLSSNPGWAISNPDWAVNTPDVNTLFNTATTYDKGACVLHQLRYIMGDSLFFIGMHNYGTSNLRFKSATIGDYAAIMSSAYGQDLSWFFNEWIYQPNHPVYANKYYISPQGTNSWEVGFQAIQTQTNTVFFQMPLQIAINYSSGPTDTLRVFNNVNNQLFTFNVTRQPVSVVFDPYNNIVLKIATLIQVDSSTSVQAATGAKPSSFILNQNYPNPFNPSTIIRFEVPKNSRIKLTIYNMLGEAVRVLSDAIFEEGIYEKTFDARDLASGVYIYELKTDEVLLRQKMVLQK